MYQCNKLSLIALLTVCISIARPQVSNAQQMSSFDHPLPKSNVTSQKSSLVAYTGAMLPPEWSLISLLNDRAVIGFTNGSARNALITELDPRDRMIAEKLQNGSLTPAFKDRIMQWSSTVTTKLTQYGKTIKDQFGNVLDSFKTNNTQANNPLTVN